MVRVLLRQGADLYRDRQYRQAIGTGRDALRLSPGNPVALVLLAVSYYGVEEWEYFARAAVQARQ
ncbi:MAG: cytochrome c biogenesis factor, partial [Acidobacteria bacterium]|nr:cytochrome c biogenesis factor [Acidobacteriota bacterium]